MGEDECLQWVKSNDPFAQHFSYAPMYCASTRSIYNGGVSDTQTSDSAGKSIYSIECTGSSVSTALSNYEC